MSFGIALVAPSFVPVVLGPQWTPMIVTMQLLALYGLCHAITGNYGEVWKTLDRPDLILKTSGLRVLVFGLFILPATARWGIEGTAFVITATYIVPILPLDIYLTAKLTELRSIDLYREYVYPFVASVTMFGTLWYARSLVEVPPIVELAVLVPAGAVGAVPRPSVRRARWSGAAGRCIHALYSDPPRGTNRLLRGVRSTIFESR